MQSLCKAIQVFNYVKQSYFVFLRKLFVNLSLRKYYLESLYCCKNFGVLLVKKMCKNQSVDGRMREISLRISILC